jgi:hypothetical protein
MKQLCLVVPMRPGRTADARPWPRRTMPDGEAGYAGGW